MKARILGYVVKREKVDRRDGGGVTRWHVVEMRETKSGKSGLVVATCDSRSYARKISMSLEMPFRLVVHTAKTKR